ncbi:MAG: Calx-beta domain-containing protein [Planctomycetaceae bacterium]
MRMFSLQNLVARLSSRGIRSVERAARRRIAKARSARSAEVLEERRVMSASPVAPVANFGVARADGFGNPQLLDWHLNTDGDVFSEISFEYGFGNGTNANNGRPDQALAGDLLGLGFDQQIVVRAHPNGKLWWFVNTDTDPTDEYNFFFGNHGDIPIVGDFNGDGRDDPAAIRAVSVDPVNGQHYSDPLLFWSIHAGSLPQASSTELLRDSFDRWGFINDRPVVGDWDGDGRDTPGLVSRLPTPQGLNRWYINQNGIVTFDFGFPTDKPVVGDWDGDGRDNAGVVREPAGANGLSRWFLDLDRDSSHELQFDYGFRGDQYVVGQWERGETVGINVSPTSGLQTTEAGGTASFTVVLTAAPTANVVIPISTSDTSEGTVSVSQLTFTTGNWNQPQTVTVRGVDDNILDGNVGYSIVTGAASSGDARYQGRNAADVEVNNRDNEEVQPPPQPGGINVTPTSGLQTTEAGGTATFSVRLTAAPNSNVVIPISTSDATEGTASVSQLTFTPSNWSQAQTVTVRGVDDTLDDGNIGYSIITGAATSSDARYQGLNAADVQVTNLDNDDTPPPPPPPPPPGNITVTPTSGLQTTEAGGTAAFSVVLTAAPTANVVIPISTSDATEGTASVSQLTFTPNNWSQPQTVTVRGVDDNLDDGDINYSIVTGAATSNDTRYRGLNADDVQVTNRDNDEPPVQNIQFAVQYADGAGEGFNDPTLGAARRRALEFALTQWSALLTASYAGEVITIEVRMDSLGGSANGATLASAGPTSIRRDFSGAIASTWYGDALANHVAQRDLAPGEPEIVAFFNGDVDNQTVLGGRDWYYGLDRNAGSDIDFVTVAMHEVGHGLNFLSLVNPNGTFEFQSRPGIWDRQLELGNGTDLTNLTTAQRQAALVGSDLFWQGAQGIAGNGGQRPEIHAPNPFQSGSSTSHLDEGTHPAELLSPFYSGVVHEPSRMEKGILVDMGWDLRGLPSPTRNASTVILLDSGISMANQMFGTIEVAAPKVSVSDVTIRESQSQNVTATFTVQLSQPSDKRVTVKYATANGDAVAGSDYTKASGTLTFAPGQTSRTISVTVRKDKIQESDEFFLLRLSQPTNADLDRDTARGTIQDSSTATPVSQALPVIAAPQTAVLNGKSLPSSTASPTLTSLAANGTSQPVSATSNASSSLLNGPSATSSTGGTVKANGTNSSPLALDQVWVSFDQLAASL